MAATTTTITIATSPHRRKASHRMRRGECGDSGNEALDSSKGNHQLKEKQQAIGAVEDMSEAHLDEWPRLRMPVGIHAHDSRIAALVSERADRAACE
jgi:hypothetical protein